MHSRAATSSADEAIPATPEPAPAPTTGGVGSDTPKFELFLGYSNVLATPMSLSNRIVDIQGGDTNIAFNLNHYFGLVGDFAGYNTNTLTFDQPGGPSHDVGANGKTFTYMGGPRFSYRRPRFTLFAQGLFGAADARAVTIDGCTVLHLASPCLRRPPLRWPWAEDWSSTYAAISRSASSRPNI